MRNRVYVFDTTLRDGEQSPGCSMTVPEKLRMARKLVDLGVDILEAGFPIARMGISRPWMRSAGSTRGYRWRPWLAAARWMWSARRRR